MKDAHKEQDEEELNLDFTKIKDFYKKNSKTIVILTLLLIPIFLSIFFRAYPMTLPITDDWAESSVHNSIKSNILNQINQQYPNLPDANKNKLVNEQFAQLQKENQGDIDGQINELSNYFKSKLQDDSGQTYLLAIDPYFYLRHVNNYFKYGQTGTIYLNEISDTSAQELKYPQIDVTKKIKWDGKRMAPVGASTTKNFHDSFGILLHKILLIFNKSQTTLATMFLIPIILCGLAVIPAFLIGKKIAGNMGGFISGMIIAINANLLSRTAGGFSDTDPYNILFPLLITWLFIESLTQKNTKKRILFASLAGLATGLFSFSWVGWWYLFDFILAAIGIYLIYLVIKHLKEKKAITKMLKEKSVLSYLKTSISYIIASGIFVSIFTAFTTFTNSITGPFGFLTIKSVAMKTLWPTILTTVAELNAASFNTIKNSVGGSLFFMIAIIGIILTFTLEKKKQESHIQMSILLTIWFAGTMYASKSGVRFILLLIPAFAIAFGVAIGLIYKKINEIAPKTLGINKKVSQGIMILLVLILLIQPLQAAHSVAKHEIPSMNDAWYNTLNKIKTGTSEDSIINSWWDFGHWFITIGDRRVTFDGAGQDKHMAYWIGRSLLSSEQEKTKGILRMVDCGNNNAFWALNNNLNDTPKSIDILNNIILLNRSSAKLELLKYTSEETSEEVLKYSHCTPPDNYYITSEDMVGKAGVWSHFGSWDFNRASMYQDIKPLKENEATILLEEKYNLDTETANKYYYEIQNTEADYWISPWPNYVSGEKSCGTDENENIICNTNIGNQQFQFIINPITMETKLNANEEVYPSSIVYATGTEIVEKKFENPQFPYSIAIIPQENGNFKSVIMSPELAMSTFTKLFFFKGHGQECFSLFNSAQQVTGGRIYTWEVDWDCQQETNIFETFKPTETINNEDKITASHILIGIENKTEEEALIEINNILDRLTSENFAEIAKEYSEGPSGVNGGTLGEFTKGQMVKPFEDVAFALEVGEISEPVLTQFGYHLILRTK